MVALFTCGGRVDLANLPSWQDPSLYRSSFYPSLCPARITGSVVPFGGGRLSVGAAPLPPEVIQTGTHGLVPQPICLRQQVRRQSWLAQYLLHPAPPLGLGRIAAFDIVPDQVLAPAIIDHIAAIMVRKANGLFGTGGRK